jgi:hypothetical protein
MAALPHLARITRAFVVALGVSTTALAAGGCSSSRPTSPPAPVTVPAPAQQLWGDMKPVVSVKELMRDMIDPIADYIFDAVGAEWSRGATIERGPKTDADWDRIRSGAVMLAESAYLLKVPRPFAPPGDENNSVGPDAEELSPAQIIEKLQRDPVLWNAKIEALRNVGLEVLDIVKRKDATELWDASENLDQACENCHLEYWYPGEKALLEKLDKRLDDMYGNMRPDRSRPMGMKVP